MKREMKASATFPIDHLRDLTRMRWLALMGQLSAYGVCTWWLGIDLPLRELLSITALLMLTNLVNLWYFKGRVALKNTEYLFQLVIDVFGLFGLLYFAGGVHNPFATLFLLQVVIAAASLTVGLTWFFAILVTVLYFILYSLSAHEHTMLHHQMMDYHLPGMVMSFSLLCFLICYFVARTSAKLRKSEQLNLENEQLVLLGAFAANTAHQLGTPLSTMSILCDTLLRGKLDQSELEQVNLMRDQVMRASAIIRELSLKSGHELASSGGPIPLDQFWQELFSQDWKREESDIELAVTSDLDGRMIVADQSLKLALINIFDNALEAAHGRVEILARVKGRILQVSVADDGPGPTEELLTQLGGPVKSAKEMGLGIGLMLSRSYFVRHQGRFTMKRGTLGGAVVEMEMSLQGLAL